MLKSYLAIFLIGEISLKSEIQIQIKVILEVFNYQSEGGKKSTKNHQANSCNCHFNVIYVTINNHTLYIVMDEITKFPPHMS